MTPARAAESSPLANIDRRQLAPEALRVLASGVRLLSLRQLGDAELADEVAQETMARLVVALERSNAHAIGNLPAFAHGIARHIISDIRRARGRLEPLERVVDSPDPRAPDPLDSLVSADEAARVRAAMRELSSRDRELLRLTFFEDLTIAALSARLGEPSLRVRKRKSRALERLRRAFFGHESEISATREGRHDTGPRPGDGKEDAEDQSE